MTKSVKHLCVALGLMVISADQLIKLLIRRFEMYDVIFRLGEICEIVHCMNTGAAFSILSGFPQLIAVFSLLLMLAAVGFLMRSMDIPKGAAVAFALLLGGGAGNFIDRILFGGVTDYIRLLFIQFPVFNLADICITVSVVILTLYLLTGRLDIDPGRKTHGANH